MTLASAALRAQTSVTLLPERALPSSARVALTLHAGDYEIRSSAGAMLRVLETRDDAAEARKTELRFTMQGGEAQLEIDPPSHGHGPHVVIELPACSALDVRMTAGELVFDAVPCAKTAVGLHAGELRASIGDPAQYRKLQASVSIGEVEMPGFGPNGGDLEKGGFFRSWSRSGSGERSFEAHVSTGQITLNGARQ